MRDDTPRSQPGGRPAAPGRLALVQAFVNTHFDLGARWGEDVLDTPAALGAWLHESGLGPTGILTAADLRRARTLRESLRTAAGDDRTQRADAVLALDRAAAEVRVALRFTPDGPVLRGAPGRGWAGAASSLLAITAEAMRDGHWARLKVCPGEHCGWLFYDASRNRSGRWCSMAVCGGRHKARARYRRARGS